MGLGRLNVWIHDSVDPCKIDDGFWFVAVTYCNGKVVEWCGHTYAGEQAKCGHAEIDLPPGCYVVFGSQIVFLPDRRISFRFTESSIVMVECDEKACVHLYTPTHRQSMKQISSATALLVQQGIPQDKADRLVEALNAALEHLPRTAQDAAFEQLIEELPKMIEKKPKEEKGPGG